MKVYPIFESAKGAKNLVLIATDLEHAKNVCYQWRDTRHTYRVYEVRTDFYGFYVEQLKPVFVLKPSKTF